MVSHGGLVVALAVLILSPAVASAATITLTTATDPSSSTLVCAETQSTTNVVAGISMTDVCDPGGAYFQIDGLAEARGSWTTSLVLGASYVLRLSGDMTAFGNTSATFEDTITVFGDGATATGFLEIHFSVDGHLTPNSNTLAQLGAHTPTASVGIDLSDGVNEVVLNLPIVFGQPTLFDIQLAVSAFRFDGGPSLIIADFNNTASLLQIAIRNADGSLVSGNISSESGLIYPLSDASTVPEPTSVFLLATGLFAARLARRRRALGRQ